MNCVNDIGQVTRLDSGVTNLACGSHHQTIQTMTHVSNLRAFREVDGGWNPPCTAGKCAAPDEISAQLLRWGDQLKETRGRWVDEAPQEVLEVSISNRSENQVGTGVETLQERLDLSDAPIGHATADGRSRQIAPSLWTASARTQKLFVLLPLTPPSDHSCPRLACPPRSFPRSETLRQSKI